MPHDRRNEPHYGRRDFGPNPRSARYQTGADWDRYRTGGEQRYSPDREPHRGASYGGYEGNRSYPAGGYAEEFGHRQRGADAMVSGGGVSFYTDFDRLGWGEQAGGEQYFGTGSHYGGGYATAPGTRASGAGTYGAPGYAGQSAWSDRYSDWLGGDRGGYRGRGPKGYQRSNERLQELICDRLTDDPRIDASEIAVEVRDRTVQLTGTVDDRRTKYDVEELVERCGALEIDNQLRVQRNR